MTRASHEAGSSRRTESSRAIRVGLIVFITSLAVLLLPLVLDLRSLNRFLVAFGLIGTFLGLGWTTNGAIDLFRGGSR
jgi:hypothetical protein